MSGSKMSIKRILAVSGAGVALATALVLAGIAHKNIKTDNLHYVAGLTPTTFVSDTINVVKRDDDKPKNIVIPQEKK